MSRRFIVNLFIISPLFLIFVYLSTFYWPPRDFLFSETPIYMEKREIEDTRMCKIPEISPWHQSVLPFIENSTEVKCQQIQPDFTYLEENGILHLDDEKVKRFELEERTKRNLTDMPSVSCQYSYFDRGSLDREIIFDEERPLAGSIRMEKNFVQVRCNLKYDLNNNSFTDYIYANLHAHPVPVPINSNFPPPVPDDLNVFLFLVESASASMVRRHLPLTLNYLTNKMGGYIFDSMLKVGENTQPNLAALFTGLRLRNEQWNMKSELKDASGNDGFYDHWPFVWKRFAVESGYITAYMEDYTHLSPFHYNGKGFREKPVDHWYFPFWQTLRLINLPGKSSPFCFGNRPIHKIFNAILTRHLFSSEWETRRNFLFSMFNDLSHDFSSDLQRADKSWMEFFEYLHRNGELDRTVLILAGDHGPRFTPIRATVAGFVEERQPFAAVWFPPAFLRRHPRLESNLRKNQKRLISMFDLHRMLVDILEKRFNDEDGKTDTPRGVSVFDQVPEERSCLDAGVPDRYCLCDGISIQPIDHPLAHPSASLVLQELGRVTKHEKQCAQLRLDKIVYFIQMGSGNCDREDCRANTYFVAFRVEPSSAVFEGAVKHNTTDHSITFVNGTLERISTFSGSRCVPTIQLKKFCACRENTH